MICDGLAVFYHARNFEVSPDVEFIGLRVDLFVNVNVSRNAHNSVARLQLVTPKGDWSGYMAKGERRAGIT